MNYRQNSKINQITTTTAIIGVDIAKFEHVARAVDDRGRELSKKISFKNNIEGFLKFEKWMYEIQSSQQKTSILIGMEPTGQYWENFAYYLQEKQYSVVTVNPMHVKKSKEFEDNNQTKTDAKDARIIATLVKDGRFNYPNLLEGEYADLREAMNVRRANLQNLQRTKNRMHRWFDRYFPEFREIFKSWESKALLYLLDRYGLPDEIAQKDPLEVYESLPKNIRMANGKTKILKIHKVCKTSIGSQKSFFGKHEFSNLLNTYEFYQKEIEQIEEIIEEISSRIDEVQKIREIKGIGLISASGIVAELGNIRKYNNPLQLCKMAGLSLKEQSSGLKKGKTTISRRGRSNLRQILYQTIIVMLPNNKAFKQLHPYFKTRAKNQLSGKASIIALSCKLLRILFAIIHKNEKYDEEKMMKDIVHPKEFLINAV